jgi:hypothetical protein
VARIQVIVSGSPHRRCSSGYLFFLDPGNPPTLVLLSLSLSLSSMHLRFPILGGDSHLFASKKSGRISSAPSILRELISFILPSQISGGAASLHQPVGKNKWIKEFLSL